MVCELNGNMVGGDWCGEDLSGLYISFKIKCDKRH